MKRSLGLGLSISVAAVSYGLSLLNPIFDPLALGIIIGIITSNLLERQEDIVAGTELAIKISLPLGIALYGFRLRFQDSIPTSQIVEIFAVLAALYLITFLVSRSFRLNTNTSILLATGMAVCGASAVAVVSPAIRARKSETSVAILAVMTTGLINTILLPVVSDLFHLSKNAYIFLCGSAMPMAGQVKMSASHFGRDAVSSALDLKSLRIASLVFMVAIAVAISGLKERKFTVPWFMVVFVVFVLAANLTALPSRLETAISNTSSIFLTLTLSAIGLNTSLDSVSELGFKPFITAIISMTTVLIILGAVYFIS